MIKHITTDSSLLISHNLVGIEENTPVQIGTKCKTKIEEKKLKT